MPAIAPTTSRLYRGHFGGPEIGGDVPSRIVFMPVGSHQVRCRNSSGEPVTLNVEVTPELAARFQQQLETRQAANVRPYIGFDHQPGPAAAIPVRFDWEDGRGIMLDLEWTGSGRAAVAGRDYSYFSPAWHQDTETTTPEGIAGDGEIGSLVNNPAFERIERLAAAAPENQSTLTNPTKTTNTAAAMTEEQIAQLQADLAAVTAERDQLAARVSELEAQVATKDTEIATAAAASLTAAAAAEGRIPEGECARWTAAIVKDPEAKVLLAALPPRTENKIQPIHKAAKSPVDSGAADTTPTQKLETYNAMSAGKAKDEYLAAHRADLLAASRATKA